MDSTAEFAQLQLRLVDQTQWRYEVIRPLVLFTDRTATQRAHETATHPDTVRALHRRFRQQGMVGLLPANIEVRQRVRTGPIPDDVREEIDRLKALYGGFHYRELARIIFCKCAYPLDDKTAKTLWHQSPVPTQHQLELWAYHTQPDRYQARLHVVKLSYQGWDKLSISRFLQVSRPTVDTWIARFEAEHCAGLMDKKRGPRRLPAKSGYHGWCKCITSKRLIQMRGNFASGVCEPSPTSQSGRSAALWRCINWCTMISPMCRSAGVSRPHSPIPTRPSTAMNIGSSMAARWILLSTASSGGAS